MIGPVRFLGEAPQEAGDLRTPLEKGRVALIRGDGLDVGREGQVLGGLRGSSGTGGVVLCTVV
jgi:hypothetical protein